MKILCISDVIDPLVYSNGSSKRFNDIDCVVAAGDLPMDYLGFIATSFTKPIFFIFGNHHLRYYKTFMKTVNHLETPELLPKTFGATYINEKCVMFRNLLIAGLGGSKQYNKNDNQFTEGGMCLKIMRLLPRLLWNRLRHGRFLDILITHSPPLGIHDMDDQCHRGFGCFLWFMKTFKPKYLLHGHVHLYDPRSNRHSQCYNTEVINVFSRYVLTVE